MNARQKKKLIKKETGRNPPKEKRLVVPRTGRVTEKRINHTIKNLENFIKIMSKRRKNK